LKSLFQRGFTPKRTAGHEPEIRAIAETALDRLASRTECDPVADVAGPVVSRVIGSFMGLPESDDAAWARIVNAIMTAGYPDTAGAAGNRSVHERDIPELIARCSELIAARRANPTDDLLSVLVHAEVHGEPLTDQEIIMGFQLLMAAGHDSTKATYTSGMLALLEHPAQLDLVLAAPSLIPGLVEESLRMFPAFSHFGRTATRDAEGGGAQIRAGDRVALWYASSCRDETHFADPDRFDITRTGEHQAFGAGGRHFCLGTSLARLELQVMFERTLARFPAMGLAAPPRYVESAFVNQLAELRVRW
jgi:cholest-4-en-3-one 26-monooxygenase